MIKCDEAPVLILQGHQFKIPKNHTESRLLKVTAKMVQKLVQRKGLASFVSEYGLTFCYLIKYNSYIFSVA